MDLSKSNIGRRVLGIVLCLTMGAAIAGFFVGTHDDVAPAWTPPPASKSAVPGALPASPYLEMNGKARGPNRDFHSDLSRLVVPGANQPAGPVVNTPQEREASIAQRAARRAYDGAPPVIPHPVTETDVTSCSTCHLKGKVVDHVVAHPMSHRFLPNCTQCHSPVGNPDIGPLFPTDVVFTGLASPGPGARAWPGAPPVIPHHTRMRENCISCHGPLGWTGIKTTHPERMNCIQCHAGDAARDGFSFAVAGELGRPAPPGAP